MADSETEYQLVRYEVTTQGRPRYQLIEQYHEPVDIDRTRRVVGQKIVKTTIVERRSGHMRVPIKSPSQDSKSKTEVFPVEPKTLGDTKPSRRASPGKTSKPFWSNGKPKCKKGFRYDFKRKLCVMIK